MCQLTYETVAFAGVSALCSAQLCFACAAAGPGEEREGGKKAAAEESAAGEEGRVACNSPAAGGRLPGGGGAENRWARQGGKLIPLSLEFYNTVIWLKQFAGLQTVIETEKSCLKVSDIHNKYSNKYQVILISVKQFVIFLFLCIGSFVKTVPFFKTENGFIFIFADRLKDWATRRTRQAQAAPGTLPQTTVTSGSSNQCLVYHHKWVLSLWQEDIQPKNVSRSILALAPIVSRSVSAV